VPLDEAQQRSSPRVACGERAASLNAERALRTWRQIEPDRPRPPVPTHPA
jgi:hypothetical protein